MPDLSKDPPAWKGAEWWHPEGLERRYRFQPSTKLASLAIAAQSLQEILARYRRRELFFARILYGSWGLLLLGIGAFTALALATGRSLPATSESRGILGLITFSGVLAAGVWLTLSGIRRRAEWAASRDRIEVTPEGLPSSAFEVRLANAQESISERVGRVLVAFAYKNMEEEGLLLSIGQEDAFDAAIEKMLRQSLPVPDENAKRFFSLLYAELLKAAQGREVEGNWGQLRADGNSLLLFVNALQSPRRRQLSEEE